jgi:hypothetical protein
MNKGNEHVTLKMRSNSRGNERKRRTHLSIARSLDQTTKSNDAARVTDERNAHEARRSNDCLLILGLESAQLEKENERHELK